MSTVKKDTIWLISSIVSFLLMSISFLLMPLENKITQLIAGIIFWVFMVFGIVLQIVLARNFRKWCLKNKEWRIRRKTPGVLNIGKNALAKVADVSLLVSIVIFLILMIFTNGAGYICYVMFTLVVYTFCMHCILNGKVYNYVLGRNNKLEKGWKKENDKQKYSNE